MDTLTQGLLSKTGEALIDLSRQGVPGGECATRGGYLGLSTRDLRAYSVLRMIRGKLDSIKAKVGSFGGQRFEGIEADAHHELVKRFGEPAHQGAVYVPADVLYRDANVANAGQGGYLVGTRNVGFVDALRNRSVVFRLGAQPMPGQVGSVTMPRQNGTSTITWQSDETSQGAESTSSYEQVAGSPKTCIAYSEISHLLLKQTPNPATESVFLSGLGADVAVGADLAVLNGAGVNGQPRGIIGTSGVGTALSAASVNYSGLVQAQTDIATNNAVVNPNALGYVAPPLIAQMLKGRQRFTGTDSPLWRGAIHEGEIEGVQALSTNQMPASTILYGDFSQVAVGEWGVLELQVNPFQDFKAGIVGLRALYSLDVFVLHPKSFTLLSSIS